MHAGGETRYAVSDGVHVAYQVVGDGDIDLLFLPSWFSHVEMIWEAPRRRNVLERLASFSRLIIFDQRGTGLSDSVDIKDVLTLEDRTKDALAVLDAAGSDRAALLGVGNTAALGCYVAAAHADRTSALVLLNASARGRPAYDYPVTEPGRLALDSDAVRRTWGTREWIAPMRPRDFTDAEVDELLRYQRYSLAPGNAATLLRSAAALDVRDVLPAIHTPTLVLHRERNRAYPIDHGRYLADNIEGARFVAVPGWDPTWGFEDPTPIAEEIQEFLTGVRPAPVPDRMLATVLFTDVVGSTAKASEVGDRKWRDLLAHHRSIVTREVGRHAGRLVNVAGEESLATFDGPARAIRCAEAVRAAMGEVGLDIRAGLHTGEIEVLGTDIAGIAVHIGARVAAMAGTGEVLVSSTVKDLVVGSGIEFEERGEHELKGVPGTWRIFAVQA